jgi:hypothetical protein
MSTQNATSVAITGGTITGITDLAVADGGTGASDASGARTNLGAAASAITISAGTGLSGGGDLSANRTLSIANTAVTAAAYGSASNTLTATVNAQGQLTALAATPIAIANTQVSGLGTASVLNAGVALGVATLDAGGTVPLSQIPASIQGGVSYQGSWNAATNTPTLTSSVGSKGYYYVVSVAGSTNLNGITDWLPGDWAIFNGTVWEQIDNTDTVASVNGYVGAVVLTAADVGAPPTTRSITAGTGLSGGGDLSANRTIAIDSTVVTLTGTQTLTNKTLTSAIANEILDTNGNEILGLSPTASATDFVTIKNGIGVGVPLHIQADGSSANIGMHIQPKGTGLVTISDGTDFNKGIRFRSSGSAAGAVTLIDAVSSAGHVITLPNATTTLVGRDTTDTLTNKTINLANNTLQATSAQIAAAVTDETGTGALVFANSPTFVTPVLGTPASGTVTNLTGTASININGTVGATTASTGAFTSVTSSTAIGTASGGTGLGGATPFTANGVVYASSTSALATGSALTFDGTNLGVGGLASLYTGFGVQVIAPSTGNTGAELKLSKTGQTAVTFIQHLSDRAQFGTEVGPLAFLCGNGTASVEGMRLTSSGLEIKQSQLIGYNSYTGIGTNGLAVAGNVGVGTASPAYKFDVNGRTRSADVGLASSSNYYHFDSYSGSNFMGLAGGTSLQTYVGGSLRTTLDSAGNLGLGVADPGGYRLNVRTAPATGGLDGAYVSDGTRLIIVGQSGATYNYASIAGNENVIYSSANPLNIVADGQPIKFSTGSERARISSDGTFRVKGAGTAGSTDAFQVAGTAPADAARIDSGGNLGVGTTSPAARLVSAGSNATVYKALILRNGDGTTGSSASIDFEASAGTQGDEATMAGRIAGVRTGSGTSGALTFSTTNAGVLSERGQFSFDGTFRVKGAGTAGSTDAFQVAGTAPADAARIDSSGNLLISATSNPWGARFVALGSGQVATFNTSATTGTAVEIDVGANDTTQQALMVYSAGNSATNASIYSNGNIVNRNNSYGAISDAKLKENVTDATPKLEKLNQVRIVNFNMIGDEQKQLGVVAQELEQIFPGMVDESPDRDKEGNDLGTTTKSVKYSVFVPMLIKAMQEQQALITSLTERIAALEAK